MIVVDKAEYAIMQTIGTGVSCKVKVGLNKATRQRSALKIFDKKFLKVAKEGVIQEVNLLSELRHPNIIQLQQFSEKAVQIKPGGKQSKRTVLVLEMAQGNDLFDYIAQTGAFDDPLCRFYFGQILSALDFAHQKGYCHRDIKAENILLCENYQIKIADFGFASLVESLRGQDKLYTKLGTTKYMAPEVLEEQPYTGVDHDLFAATVLLFILRTMASPWTQASPQHDPHYKAFCKNPDKFWKAHLNTQKMMLQE